MIERYIERSALYALQDERGRIIGDYLLADEGGGVLEIKSLAVLPECQRQGAGRAIVEFVAKTYRSAFSTLQAGTGESPLTLSLYKKLGFRFSHRIPDFFAKNYSHPIVDGRRRSEGHDRASPPALKRRRRQRAPQTKRPAPPFGRCAGLLRTTCRPLPPARQGFSSKGYSSMKSFPAAFAFAASPARMKVRFAGSAMRRIAALTSSTVRARIASSVAFEKAKVLPTSR